MLIKTLFRVGSTVLVFTLGACSWLHQDAVSVKAAKPGAPVSGSAMSANPYGAPPYKESDEADNGVSPVVATPVTIASATATTSVTKSNDVLPSSYAAVDINAPTHTVTHGDTVYNIAKRYNIAQDSLRKWNNIGADNIISIGQILRVKPDHVVPKPSTDSIRVVSKPLPDGVRIVSGIAWQRPTDGSIIAQFSQDKRGVDIAGKAGQVVVAAADGKVLYAGSGLRGYGNLLIVEHKQSHLTAYGHNQDLLVKEGQTVKRGQAIARMGSSGADRVKLHFEVRKDGKPVDPALFIKF